MIIHLMTYIVFLFAISLMRKFKESMSIIKKYQKTLEIYYSDIIPKEKMMYIGTCTKSRKIYKNRNI